MQLGHNSPARKIIRRRHKKIEVAEILADLDPSLPQSIDVAFSEGQFDITFRQIVIQSLMFIHLRQHQLGHFLRRNLAPLKSVVTHVERSVLTGLTMDGGQGPARLRPRTAGADRQPRRSWAGEGDLPPIFAAWLRSRFSRVPESLWHPGQTMDKPQGGRVGRSGVLPRKPLLPPRQSHL